jgi:hypothetical protein
MLSVTVWIFQPDGGLSCCRWSVPAKHLFQLWSNVSSSQNGEHRPNVGVWGSDNHHTSLEHITSSLKVNMLWVMTKCMVRSSLLNILEFWLISQLLEHKPGVLLTRWRAASFPHWGHNTSERADVWSLDRPRKVPLPLCLIHPLNPSRLFLWGYIKSEAFVPQMPEIRNHFQRIHRDIP